MSRFPRFHDFDPSSLQFRFTCIHPCKARDFRRCTHPVNKVDRGDAADLRIKILRFDGSEDEIWRDLIAYAELCCCKQSHRKTARKLGRYHGVASEWLTELVEQTQSTPRAEPSLPLLSRFIPYHSDNEKARLRFAVEMCLPTRTSADGISLLDSGGGTLYMIRRSEDPGFYKIGYTTQDVDVRLASMEAECDFVPIPVRQIRNVSCIRRVEKLVHAELIQWRRECTTCGKSKCHALHSEWFEIDEDHAMDVMKRWARWVTEADPYEAADGALKEPWIQTLLELDASRQPPTSANLLDAIERRQSEEGALVISLSALKL